MIVGVGTGLDSRGQTKTYILNEQGGEYLHQMTIDELVNHNHIEGSTAFYNTYGGGTAVTPLRDVPAGVS